MADSKQALPKIIQEVGFDFRWDIRKVWALDVAAEDIPITELTWHFDIPFWSQAGGYYNLLPRDVMNNQDEHTDEYERTMKADTSHPIDIMQWRGRWLILDGLHRLLKLAIEGNKMVSVRKIPVADIPKIIISS